MSQRIATIDFHVTAACTQDCAYCWGPPQHMPAASSAAPSAGLSTNLGTEAALVVIERVRAFGVRRIVFTGGDPLLRADIVQLIRHARAQGLEVAVSTTGDWLTREFLANTAGCIDLVSLPVDGSTEAINALTKQPGHFTAIMAALDMLGDFPDIDIKVCTAVTQRNIEDVANIAALVDRWAQTVPNRVFYNLFQVFPRSWEPRLWDELLVSDEAWAAMVRAVEARHFSIRINFLSTEVLDGLYVLIFPDGGLYVPSGPAYHYFGPFSEIEDLDAILNASDFDSIKHLRHSEAWSKERTV
ncbi:MAG: radical SAM protein [Anaerolineae bacterium]